MTANTSATRPIIARTQKGLPGKGRITACSCMAESTRCVPAGDTAQDVLYDGENVHVLSGPRIKTQNTHGTGCTTASAIAAELAKGSDMLSAARAAKTYVSEALQSSVGVAIGSGSQRPFNHGCASCCSTQLSWVRRA